MFGHRLERLARALPGSVSRRILLYLLAALPAAAGLADLLDEDVEAGRRRQRRRARHRHNPGRRKENRKGKRKRCRRKTKFCANRCGPVKKKGCKKPLNCGPCRVFLTSTTRDGNLGGLSGADAICQGLATDAGLPGSYLAWLSDETQSPATRFKRSSGPYALVNGVTIANDWTDLTGGTLDAAITVAETGATFDDLALRSWTHTLADGTAGGVLDEQCDNWSTGANGVSGDEGQVAATSDNWTDFASGTCNNLFHLYCFQQS